MDGNTVQKHLCLLEPVIKKLAFPGGLALFKKGIHDEHSYLCTCKECMYMQEDKARVEHGIDCFVTMILLYSAIHMLPVYVVHRCHAHVVCIVSQSWCMVCTLTLCKDLSTLQCTMNRFWTKSGSMHIVSLLSLLHYFFAYKSESDYWHQYWHHNSLLTHDNMVHYKW